MRGDNISITSVVSRPTFDANASHISGLPRYKKKKAKCIENIGKQSSLLNIVQVRTTHSKVESFFAKDLQIDFLIFFNN